MPLHDVSPLDWRQLCKVTWLSYYLFERKKERKDNDDILTVAFVSMAVDML